MSSFKTLHSFKVSIPQEVEKTEKKIENNQEITIKSKVTEPVEYEIFLKEPTRRERGNLSLRYGKMYNEALTEHKLLPRVFIVQNFVKDPNNPLSRDDDKNLAKMYEQLEGMRNDYLRMRALPDSDDNKERVAKLEVEFLALSRKVSDIESAYQSLFAHTAENYAQGKSIEWLVLNLSYIKGPKDSDPRHFFEGRDYQALEEDMYKKEDDKDPLYFEAVDRLSTYWTFYFNGQATDSEAFKRLEDAFQESLKKQEEAAKKPESEPVVQSAG